MANDITILSCPQCGFPRIRDCGNGLYQCDDCGTHFDKSENIVQTEQEYLQTCSTEQLVHVIHLMTSCCYVCGKDGVDYKRCYFHKKCTGPKEIEEWLKQPHRNE